MADSVNLSIPSSAAERADINTITQLLNWYRNGDLNNEQMIRAIRDFAKVHALSTPVAGADGMREALAAMIYETTHLSAEDDMGGHTCRISKATLERARAALSPGASND